MIKQQVEYPQNMRDETRAGKFVAVNVRPLPLELALARKWKINFASCLENDDISRNVIAGLEQAEHKQL